MVHRNCVGPCVPVRGVYPCVRVQRALVWRGGGIAFSLLQTMLNACRTARSVELGSNST